MTIDTDELKAGLLIVLWILLMGAHFGTNAYFFEYFHGNVRLEYEADVQQCQAIIDELNDKEIDLINYERKNTDDRQIDDKNKLSECRKLLENPDRFVKGRYIEFWFGFILLNGIIWLLYTLICIVILCKD